MNIHKYLSIHMLVYFFIGIFICGIASSQSYGADLCKGNEATIECLMKNTEELYANNYSLFWDILNKASTRAQDCKSLSDVSQFMKIIRIRRDGEVAEFFNEKIEHFCVTNTKCFFNALISMSKEDQDQIIDLLLNPLFVDQVEITDVFGKVRKDKNYKLVADTYFKKLRKGKTK